MTETYNPANAADAKEVTTGVNIWGLLLLLVGLIVWSVIIWGVFKWALKQ